MPLTPTKYPYDPKGTNTTNRVVGEFQVIGSGKIRSVVPHYGPFYAQSLRVYDRITGQPLIHNVQYQSLYMDEALTLKTRQEVCGVVAFIDPDLPANREVELHYQTVGGEYTNKQSIILEMLKGIDLDDRPVKYKDIEGKPEAFVPSPHQHDIGDTYGWEFVLNQLTRIREAILVGDKASHDEILRVFDDAGSVVDQDIETARQTVLDALDTHRSRTDNPHQTTAHQIGLGLVPNYPPADMTITLEGESDEHVVVPAGVTYAVTQRIGVPLDQHIADNDNPHGTTKAQVGLSQVANYPVADDVQATQGLSDEAYITAYGVSLQIAEHALAPLQTHESRTDNPHGTTKAQVGLDLVPNYPPSTISQAEAGEDDQSLLTPKGAWRAIQVLFTDPITTHKSRTDNPHNVTKADIGLPDVDNYSRTHYDARYAFKDHSHTYADLPFTLEDTLRWNQAKSDLETLESFDPMGDYPGLRARATRARDIGLGLAPNWSLQMFQDRFAAKNHTHDEFLTEAEGDARYLRRTKWSELVSWSELYANYAIDRYLKGENVSYPTPPQL